MERIKNFQDFALNERELPDNQGKILVILGSPGSGKGTLSKELKKKYDFIHLSTGDLIRNSEDEDIKKIIDAGNLLPDNMMIKMLRKELRKVDPSSNVILDGFPRTIEQANALDQLLSEMKIGLQHVLNLSVPDNELLNRLLERAKIEGRADDNEETIKNRLINYNNKTFPLLDYYKGSGLLREINGLGSVGEITSLIRGVLK